MRERGDISEVLTNMRGLKQSIEDAGVFLELSEESGGDQGLIDDAAVALKSVENTLNEMEKLRMLSGPHDQLSAIVTIKPGAGGTESQDWASILYRMYLRYCQQKGWAVEVTDYQDGEEAGIKMAEFRVEGPFAFGYLKAEDGVHRLVRISPFDSNKRRHTSFAAVSVVPEIDDDIEVEINNADLRIDTYRASGVGG